MRNEVVNTQLDMHCTISRRTQNGTDPGGQPIWVWAQLAANVHCHWWREINVEIVGGINAEVTRDRLVFAANTDIKETDRITYLTDVDGDVMIREADAPLELTEVIQQINQVTCSARKVE